MIRNYFSIGNAYRNIDSLELAIENYKIAEKKAINAKDDRSLALVYMNEGQVYKKRKQYKIAEEKYLQAIKLNETKNQEEKERIANSYINIADLYKEMGKNTKAISYLNKAKTIVKKFTNPESILGVYDNLAQVYDSLSNWQLAYKNHKNYSDLKDSIRKASIEKTIADMTAKYETEKKEQQIKSLEQQKELDESRRRNLNIAFGIGIISLMVFVLIMYNRYRLKKRSNLLLEKQKNLIEEQKLIVDEKNEEILSSVRYAEGIQQAMMPIRKEMDDTMEDYFLMFQPKDIVSGDFYWFAETGGTIFIAAVDCTGHGIPGAMLSLVGTMILNEAVKVNGVYDPDLILEYLNQKVTIFFRQDQEDVESQDGMDVCLVKIPQERDKILFSGAKRPLFVSDAEGNYQSIRGDLKSIGGRQRKKDLEFTTKEVPIKAGTSIYLLSDGFIDQIGMDGKKYGTKNFKKFIQKNHNYTMKEQARILDFDFKNHIGDEEQRDDITVIGIKF